MTHAVDPHSSTNAPLPSRRRVLIVTALMSAVGLAVGAYAMARRVDAQEKTRASAEPSKEPRKLRFTTGKQGSASVDITLPGSVRALKNVTLVARSTGAVRDVKVNIGDSVKKGQLLATIEADEVSAQLDLAKAKLTEAQQNVGIVRMASDRASRLAEAGTGTQQDAETASGHLNTAKASVEVNRAEVNRLGTLVRYQQVLAPFDGTITRRWVDPGALASMLQTQLFDVASTSDLVVTVDVPQAFASLISVGTEAEVLPRTSAASAQTTKAKVARTSGALDPVARTLRVELDLPEGSPILAGTYVNVHLARPRNERPLLIPSTVLSVDSRGMRVAVLSATNQVEFRPVEITRDLGRDVEVSGNLRVEDRLILYPPTDLAEGETVNAVAVEQKPAN
ncbi:MAG: efflux RND transporter periplasmic adaptor subunit [Polyangiaceae bacterium]